MASSNLDGSNMETNKKFPQKLAKRVRERVVGRPGLRMSSRVESTSTLLRTRDNALSFASGSSSTSGSASASALSSPSASAFPSGSTISSFIGSASSCTSSASGC